MTECDWGGGVVGILLLRAAVITLLTKCFIFLFFTPVALTQSVYSTNLLFADKLHTFVYLV